MPLTMEVGPNRRSMQPTTGPQGLLVDRPMYGWNVIRSVDHDRVGWPPSLRITTWYQVDASHKDALVPPQQHFLTGTGYCSGGAKVFPLLPIEALNESS